MAVAKIIEIVGNSTKGWEDAVRNAVAEAAETVKGISGVEVRDMTAKVVKNKITEYKATVKIAFLVEETRK
ncbi:MAG TPA: dodecin family protein [Acidobacteriota bacterium]|jgi:hypothetical protein